MLNLLQNINPADIIAFARAIPNPEEFRLTASYVPERQIRNVKYRIKSSEKRVNTAKFRAYDAETPFGKREVTHSILEGFLPPVGAKFLVNELEEILLSLDRGADDEALIEAIYDDVERGVLGIRARLELAAGDLLTDGKFTLADENGLTLEADFEVPAENLPTAAHYWGAADATPLSDEQGWIAQLVANGSGRPGRALASLDVISKFAGNHEYQEAYFGRGQETYPTLNPAQVNSVRTSNGLPAVEEYDTQVRVDGSQTRVIPANRFLLLPANSSEFAETQYGITAEALALSRSGNSRITREDQPGIICTTTEQDDPVRVLTKATAVAMPVMYDPEAYICAKVLA